MDALITLNENFLSCNICTEIFKDPCTIGCYHTFCRSCLTKYTKTRRDAITAKSILCPNCNQMTKVSRPQEPVDQWCQQFKPSFLIQGLLDTFTSQESSGPVDHRCFTCQQIGKTTWAKSVCEDCDILFCEACAQMHVATPMAADHMISPLGTGSTKRRKKRKVMCREHNCLVEFCCKDCQKAVCNKCCIVYHRKCHSVVTIESMIPEMKQVLQQNYYHINLQSQTLGNILKRRRSEVEEILQHKSSLQTEIRRVSQQAVDLIRGKEMKLLDELDVITEKQTGEVRGQIKSGEIDLQTYQQYTEFIKQVIQSDSLMDLCDMYMLCQSGEITAEIQRKDKRGDRMKKVKFENQLNVDQIDRILQLGQLKFIVDKSNSQDTPEFLSTVRTDARWNPKCTPKYLVSCKSKDENSVGVDQINRPFQRGHLKFMEDRYYLQDTPKLVSVVSSISKNDKHAPNNYDIEILNIGGTDTLVVTDLSNSSVKSCYTKYSTSHCTAFNLHSSLFHNEPLSTLTNISQDTVAVSYDSSNTIELIKLTPNPVHVSSIKTRKKYRCLTALSDTTLAAGCYDPPSIDVLDLSGRVLRSVITPSTGQKMIQSPQYMCTTRQGHILVVDGRSNYVCCVTQQGEVLYTHELKVCWFEANGSVTTTDTGSVIVADYNDNKIVLLTETGEYVRDLLTVQDGLDWPHGIRVHGNKLYVAESKQVKIFQL